MKKRTRIKSQLIIYRLGMLKLSLLLILCFSLLSCDFQSQKFSFESDWENVNNRIWTGSAFWANPLQDWRIHNGQLQCIQQGRDRNIHLLTRQLQPSSSLEMQIKVSKPVTGFNGWIGYRFASHGNIDEYRHNTINSTTGFDAKLRSDGMLIINNDSMQISWDEQLQLVLILTPRENFHLAEFLVKDAGGKEMGKVESKYESSEIHGNLAVVCHSFENINHSYGKPVVSFTNLKVKGNNLRGGDDQRWGPILWSQYTVNRGLLKLSAQFPPLGEKDDRTVYLEINNGDGWEKAAEAEIDDLARVALFRMNNWDESKTTPYRIVYSLDNKKIYYTGEIRKNPVDAEELKVAAFTGNKDYGFPNIPIVENLYKVDPDLLFFSGDQIYESVSGYGITRNPLDIATLDYLRKWYLIGWTYGNLLRNIPSVIIPDDHDVYQGNLWGQGGRKLPEDKGFSYGGYRMDPEWVNMVQRTQTASLPDAFDSTPVKRGITVYYTDLNWGNVSFAILEDRKFKTGSQSEEANDPDQRELLGDRQHEFLSAWVRDWKGVKMKATLSQTVFAQCHTRAGGNEGDAGVQKSTDSNGWPPEQRNEALRQIRKGYAFMIAGDNHLPTVAHHGIDHWEDAGISFTVPSINAGFPRAWLPEQAGMKKYPGLPEYFIEDKQTGDIPDYVGRFISPWGHPLTMLATANPVRWGGSTPGDYEMLQKKRSGFGLVRFNTNEREITIECYPFLAKINENQKDQYEGWPIVIDQKQNYGRQPVGYLKELSIKGNLNPVLKVFNEVTGELIYAIRLQKNKIRPWVYENGRYRAKLGYPETNMWEIYENLEVEE